MILGRPHPTDPERIVGSGSLTPAPVDLWLTLLSPTFVLHAAAHPRIGRRTVDTWISQLRSALVERSSAWVAPGHSGAVAGEGHEGVAAGGRGRVVGVTASYPGSYLIYRSV